MDWLVKVVYLTAFFAVRKIYCIKHHSPSSNYEPMVADNSIRQAAYAYKLQTGYNYPQGTEDKPNTLIGLPSIKPQMVALVNPVLPFSRVPLVMQSSSRSRPNSHQRSPNQHPGRGVTLDIRGGGYKVEPHVRPYKSSDRSVSSSQRHPSIHNPERTVNRNNRKPSPRPRQGPNMKNPHYNIKFESSLPSIPRNVEFVNPENVLPLHPNIYKPFLQQNKNFGSYIQSINKQNSFSKPQRNAGNRGQKNEHSSNQIVGRRPSRNRMNLAQQSTHMHGLQNFGQFSNHDQFSIPNQQISNQFMNFDMDAQDPNFLAALSQSPEGLAYLGQMYQQNPSEPSKKLKSSQQQPFSVGGPQRPNGFPTLSSGLSLQVEPANYFENPHGMVQYENQNQPMNHQKPSNDYQQMMSYFQQQLNPVKQQFSGPQNQPPFRNTAFRRPSSRPNNQNAEYQYLQEPHYSTSQQSNGKNEGNYPNPYENNPHQHGQTPGNFVTDDTTYTLPPYSPVDPTAHQGDQDYFGYHSKSPLFTSDPSHSYTQLGSSAIHEISPYTGEKIGTAKRERGKGSKQSGYLTPEQLLTQQSTGVQTEAKLEYEEASEALNAEPTETELIESSKDEQQEGDRAALHLPEEVSIYVPQPNHPYTESYDPFLYEIVNQKPNEGVTNGTRHFEIKHKPFESDFHFDVESDEKLHESIKEYQKLLTKTPKNSYMVEPSSPSSSTKAHWVTTTQPPKKHSEPDEYKNHKTTHSYMFQYSPSPGKPTWQYRKQNSSRYHLPLPDSKQQAVTTLVTTTETTTTTTQSSMSPSATTNTILPMTTLSAYYHEPDTPICARHNNLTYCLHDPEYPKSEIKEAIQRNRHPLDHFLVDISSSSTKVDDNTVLENSVPLQSTSISYSFEGKVINSSNNTAGCASNVYYAKPLRAINTAGLWKIIVNVEFEETGANYTQTVRIEECSHTSGYVATCGTETISACLQQYKLYRLLAWEAHRGFYIDAFLLPISCFCGSQQSS